MPERLCSRCSKTGHTRRSCTEPAPGWVQALEATREVARPEEGGAPAQEGAKVWPTDVIACLEAIEAELALLQGTHPISEWWWSQIREFYASERWTFVGRVGRRGGKSDTVAKIALAEILSGRHKIPMGDKGTVAIVSVDREEASKRVATIAAYARALGIPHKANAYDIEFKDRPYVVEVKTASVRGVSGFTSIMCVCDEMDKWEDAKTGANPADAVIESLEPTLLTMMPGARMFLLSSPWLMAGPHARRFDEGTTPEQLTAYAPSWIAHPAQTREKCWALSRGNQRKFLREYEAIPQPGNDEDEGGITPERIERAIGAEHGAEPSHSYQAALYACPRTNAWSLMVATRRRGLDALVRTAVVHVSQWPAQIDARELMVAVRGKLAEYGLTWLCTPAEGFAVATKRLADPLAVTMVPVTDEMHESLRVRFASDGIEIPDVADLRADILAQRKRVTLTSTAFEARRFVVLLALLASRVLQDPPPVVKTVARDLAWWQAQDAAQLAHDMKRDEAEGYRIVRERNERQEAGDWVGDMARELGYG